MPVLNETLLLRFNCLLIKENKFCTVVLAHPSLPVGASVSVVPEPAEWGQQRQCCSSVG